MKKKVFIILSAVFVLVFLSLAYIYWPLDNDKVFKSEAPVFNSDAPVFMTAEEKKEFFIPEDKNIQVLRRGEEGEIMIYKIINNENDIIYSDGGR